MKSLADLIPKLPPGARFRWINERDRQSAAPALPFSAVGWFCLPAFTDLGENYFDRDPFYRSKPRTFGAYCSAPTGVRCSCASTP